MICLCDRESDALLCPGKLHLQSSKEIDQECVKLIMALSVGSLGRNPN